MGIHVLQIDVVMDSVPEVIPRDIGSIRPIRYTERRILSVWLRADRHIDTGLVRPFGLEDLGQGERNNNTNSQSKSGSGQRGEHVGLLRAGRPNG
jgi:hypothetical protein